MDADTGPATPADLPSIDAGPEVEQFANALDDCLSPLLANPDRRRRLLNLPKQYHQNALRRLAQLQPRNQRSSHDDADMETDDADTGAASQLVSQQIERLKKEAQTWDLLGRVLPLRHDFEDPPHLFKIETPADHKAREESLYPFFLGNNTARERRAVLQWLQTNASSGPDIDDLTRDLQQNADRGDIIAHGWLHTRSAIKMKKSVTGWPHLLDRQSANISNSHTTSSGAPLVTQLDPDAMTRQDRRLQPQDEYFERAIWLGCFEHLRRGSTLETIRDWCQERTEMWRAISMSGILLTTEDEETAYGSNPLQMALWRRMCFGLARQGGSDDYERAVYGLLSGDIISVEKVARTWDDFLFAHYNALLRTQIDNYYLGRCAPGEASNLNQTFPSFDAVQFHGEESGLEKRLIQTLESQPSIRKEALEPNKALQASVIGRDIESYLYNQGKVLNSSPDSLVGDYESRKYFRPGQHDGLRIVAHVYVLATLLDKADPRTFGLSGLLMEPAVRAAQENIIAHYADFLRRAGLQELIPIYCSILEPRRCYEVLSSTLIMEDDHDRRLTMVQLMKRTTIDVVQFVKTQASLLYDKVAETGTDKFEAETMFKILEDGPATSRKGRSIQADFFGDDPDAVETSHEHLIRSLEWLMAVENTWPDVFSFGTKIYKFFLRHMHLRAARRLLKKVPFASVMANLGADPSFDEAWYDSPQFWAQQLESSGIPGTTPQKVLADSRNFRQLEALVSALDNLETMGAFADVSLELVFTLVPSLTSTVLTMMQYSPWTARILDSSRRLCEEYQGLYAALVEELAVVRY